LDDRSETKREAAFALGREEWLALPQLGLPAVRAKVDTGASTSALHAEFITPFMSDGELHVRFITRPIPGRQEPAITCIAKVIDKRRIASSSGERELRHVIRTEVAMGGRKWPIEVTLTGREGMRFRMLLGRQALQPDMVVQPTRAYLQPELDLSAYQAGLKRDRTALRIGLLTRHPSSASNRRLFEAAIARGHLMEPISPDWCIVDLDPALPRVRLDTGPLPPFDAVLARIGRSPSGQGMAVLRQLESMGVVVVNPCAAIEGTSDPLRVHQRLSAAGLKSPYDRIEGGALVADDEEAAGTPVKHCLVVDGRFLAAAERQGEKMGEATVETSPEERRLAVQTSRLFSLKWAEVDIGIAPSGPFVLDVSPAPQLGRFRGAPSRLPSRIISAIERALV
jgi:glutathione synthase/RimK-type ligase-like ATP-grasp enzyme